MWIKWLEQCALQRLPADRAAAVAPGDFLFGRIAHVGIPVVGEIGERIIVELAPVLAAMRARTDARQQPRQVGPFNQLRDARLVEHVAQMVRRHISVGESAVRGQAALVVDRLRRHRTTTFRALVSDADSTLVVIGRFLALLELYREQVVAFEQLAPLGDLTIRWTGSDEGDVDVTDEFDIEREVDRVTDPESIAGTPAEPAAQEETDD